MGRAAVAAALRIVSSVAGAGLGFVYILYYLLSPVGQQVALRNNFFLVSLQA